MNKTAFFAAVRPLFGGSMTQAQVNGCEHLLAATDGLPIFHRAYLMATAHHETAKTMQPVRETLAATDDQAINRLEAAWKRGQLKWVSKPYWRKDKDGKAWFGRGYVQLTHKDNYEKAGKMVGVDLVRDPSQAMNPAVAARVLVQGSQRGIFTGKKLADYLDGPRPDYVQARRIINGTDRAADIAKLAEGYEKAIRAGETAAPVSIDKPAFNAGVDAALKPTGIASALLALWKALTGGRK